MADEVNGIRPLTGPGVKPLAPSPQKAPDTKGIGFEEYLINELRDVKFSKHALERLRAAGLSPTKQELGQILMAVEKAQSKGVKDSLVLLDRMALVVSIKNRTVITALEPQRAKDNVFTNIDGAVIVGEHVWNLRNGAGPQ